MCVIPITDPISNLLEELLCLSSLRISILEQVSLAIKSSLSLYGSSDCSFTPRYKFSHV
jgi:hypothetical protein